METRSNAEALYAARVTASNLRYLAGTWRGAVHDDTLRRSSSALRDLLIHDEFGRAWRALGFGGEPHVSAIDLRSVLNGYDPSRIGFAQAGGAEFIGMKVAALCLYRIDGLDESSAAGGDPPFADFGLHDFLDSPSLVVAEVDIGPPVVRTPHWVKRREVVKYVANRLGGSHVSAGRTAAEKRLFGLLDRAGTATVFGKSGIFWEELSIGQAVARSDDAHRLIAAVQDRTGPITEPVEPVTPNVLERLAQVRCPDGSSHDSKVVQERDGYRLICSTCPAVWAIQPRQRTPVPVAAAQVRVR